MITKLQAKDAKVDWDRVNKLTEIRRTYLVRTKDGREFFKMYKPSEVKKHLAEGSQWKFTMVGTRTVEKPKPQIRRANEWRSLEEMFYGRSAL